jgi:hypothetical protein
VKRTVVAVLLGLVVVSGCGRAQEAPTVVLPQEAPVAATVDASPVPSSSPFASPSVTPARVVVEDPAPVKRKVVEQPEPTAEPRQAPEVPAEQKETPVAPKPDPVMTPTDARLLLPEAGYYSDQQSCEARGFVWTPGVRADGSPTPSGGTCKLKGQ